MSDEETVQAKNEFMSKIDVWKTGRIRGDSLLASRYLNTPLNYFVVLVVLK